jgi:hypothetical protein
MSRRSAGSCDDRRHGDMRAMRRSWRSCGAPPAGRDARSPCEARGGCEARRVRLGPTMKPNMSTWGEWKHLRPWIHSGVLEGRTRLGFEFVLEAMRVARMVMEFA